MHGCVGPAGRQSCNKQAETLLTKWQKIQAFFYKIKTFIYKNRHNLCSEKHQILEYNLQYTKTQRQIILHCRQKAEYLDIFNKIIVLNIEEYDQQHVSAAVRQQCNQTSELSHR